MRFSAAVIAAAVLLLAAAPPLAAAHGVNATKRRPHVCVHDRMEAARAQSGAPGVIYSTQKYGGGGRG